MAAPLMIAATAFQTLNVLSEGAAANEQAKADAAQMRVAAGQQRAVAQRSMIEQRRQTERVLSRAQAVAAASGAGASGPGVDRILGNIAAEGEARALAAIYEGENAARQLEGQADQVRFAGRQERRASYMGAAGSLLEGGSSIYDRFRTPTSGGTGGGYG